MHPITALQTEYSLWTPRRSRRRSCRRCRELGIGFVAYSPLGRGFLTGRFKSPDELDEDDFRRTAPRFTGRTSSATSISSPRSSEIAAEKGCTPGQLALAWVLAQGDDVVPIPGTKRRDYLEENVAALDVELTDRRPTARSTRRSRRRPAIATTRSG